MRANQHPDETALALYAGRDLGAIARWRVARHLKQCERCQEEVAAYQGVRRMVADLAEMPDVPWNRLAAEMQANIRLGLAAGECVGGEPVRPAAAWWTARAVVAAAGVVVMIATGLMLQRPAPRVDVAKDAEVVEATANGIRIAKGGETLGAKSAAGWDVSYSVSAQGSTGASYVDPVTGAVMVQRFSW